MTCPWCQKPTKVIQVQLLGMGEYPVIEHIHAWDGEACPGPGRLT
jgi:hypothetical protein